MDWNADRRSWCESRDIRRVRRRGKIRIGIRTDAPGCRPVCGAKAWKCKLARRIACEIFGDEACLEIVPLEPSHRLKVLEVEVRLAELGVAVLGDHDADRQRELVVSRNVRAPGGRVMSGGGGGRAGFRGTRLLLGPADHAKLHKFRSLEDAAHGRFLQSAGLAAGTLSCAAAVPPLVSRAGAVRRGKRQRAGGERRYAADYLRAHLAEVERAIEDGVPVKGYNFWSITSNREWGHAFDPNTDFGLYFVDLDKDPELQAGGDGRGGGLPGDHPGGEIKKPARPNRAALVFEFFSYRIQFVTRIGMRT